MTKPKKRKLPKNAEDLTSDEVMQAIFGKRVQEQLKREANPDADTDDESDAPVNT